MSFGRLERTPGPRPMSEINMTPLIDVMLVLLVIFIVTAPLMASRLPLDLPSADAARPGTAAKSLAVSITPQGELFLADEKLDRDALTQRLRQAAKADPATEVLLRADETVPYGRVAELLGLLQLAGLQRIGFVTEPAAAPAAAPQK